MGCDDLSKVEAMLEVWEPIGESPCLPDPARAAGRVRAGEVEGVSVAAGSLPGPLRWLKDFRDRRGK